MAGVLGPGEQKRGRGLRLAPERVGPPHSPPQPFLPGPDPGSHTEAWGPPAHPSTSHVSPLSPAAWTENSVPENSVCGERRPPGASKAVRQPWVQELGPRGHESPRRLGGRTGPVPSSSHTYAAPTACGQGRDRADTAALRRPGVYAVARRPPDRQRGGAGLPEEGRGAHTVDGGLPPVRTARPPPPDRTCPCLDGQWGWGGCSGGPGLWMEDPQGAVRKERPGR